MTDIYHVAMLPGYTRLAPNRVRSRCRQIGHCIIACRCRSRKDRRRGQAIDFAITKATGIHHRESYSANIIYGPLICTHLPIPTRCPPYPRSALHEVYTLRPAKAGPGEGSHDFQF